MTSVQDFLMGGGLKGVKFAGPGTSGGGKIVREPDVRQQTDYSTKEPKFFKNGDPMMQLVVAVQTDERDPADPTDDGVRGLYIKGDLTRVVRDAVRASGAHGLQVGGTLIQTWVSGGPRYTGDTTWPKESPKIQTAVYTPPAQAAVANLLNGGAAPTQAATAGAPAGQPPTGIDPALWEQLSEQQRASVLAAHAGVR